LLVLKQFGHAGAIGQIEMDKAKLGMIFELLPSCLLQAYVVIGIHGVESDDRTASLEQSSRDVKSDESGCARDQDWLRHLAPHPRS
jgi:hypothetical protein